MKKHVYIFSFIIIVLVIMVSVFAAKVLFNKGYNNEESQLNNEISQNAEESGNEESQNSNEQIHQDNSKEDISKEEIVKRTVVIDAGHQLHANNGQEPIGPGSEETKVKVSSGTQGSFTKTPEYEINLEVSRNLQGELINRGYNVVMIRDNNDVNISNIERANIANESNADILVRIHCNGAEDSSQKGALTMCPTQNNPYVSNLYTESRKLSEDILSGLCSETGAKRCNIIETDNMSGINWSKIPVTIVEMGFMTNKEEDYLLNNSDYQKKLVTGIANGIDSYFN